MAAVTTRRSLKLGHDLSSSPLDANCKLVETGSLFFIKKKLKIESKTKKACIPDLPPHLHLQVKKNVVQFSQRSKIRSWWGVCPSCYAKFGFFVVWFNGGFLLFFCHWAACLLGSASFFDSPTLPLKWTNLEAENLSATKAELCRSTEYFLHKPILCWRLFQPVLSTFSNPSPLLSSRKQKKKSPALFCTSLAAGNM